MSDEVQSLDQPAELTATQEFQALDYARKINKVQDYRKRQGYILIIVRENMQLLKELNEARRALGLDPLPVVDNSKARIA
jgi:hypothetical protein